MLVDVHAHLDHAQFKKDLDEVIGRAKKARIVAVINNGLNVETNRQTLDLAKKYSIIKPALGLYPTFAEKMSMQEIKTEFDFIKKQKIIAIGECGLDNKYVLDEKKQQKVFSMMIELAEKMKLPIIVHSRQSEEKAIEMLESSKLKKIVMHCFCGGLKLVKRIEKNGWYFSVPPSVNYSKTFQELVEQVSINQLITETDSPYLAHKKTVRNEPENIKYSIQKISEIKKLDLNEVEKIFYMNFRQIF
ncbi:MAG: TatD family hydrolase [archaeon]